MTGEDSARELLAGWEPIPELIRCKSPVVHCITNYVTAGWCADALLAVGASPIMADDLREIDEIVSMSGALVLNIGTLNERTVQSMCAAAESACRQEKPILLDPVGAGASRLRSETALSLMERFHPEIIRGNMSEILALAGEETKIRGVDVDPSRSVDTELIGAGAETAAACARRWGTVVGISGPFDVISDGTRTCAVGGGDAMMTRVTGCGCMLSALAGGYLTVTSDPWTACAASFTEMSLCGHKAGQMTRAAEEGTGTFRAHLLDRLNLFTGEKFRNAEFRIL